MDTSSCTISPVGKRRDGGTRYWCTQHHGDATAKYGVAAERCRYAHVTAPADGEIVEIDPDEFPGGIGLWGAVPPVFDTTTLPIDRGIHVHARKERNGEKQVDATFRRVVLKGQGTSGARVELNELDSIYYMVSSVLDRAMCVVTCTRCGYSHLDKDWFAVHAHQRHLCSGCGFKFSDSKPGIGNPAVAVRVLLEGAKARKTVDPARSLDIRQADFPGGIQIWGSNPAIVWTSTQPEEEGIHIHGFQDPECAKYAIDNTYTSVSIDGIRLDPAHVRTLMGQNALPHIAGRVRGIVCPYCDQQHFDHGELAYVPHDVHHCEWCGREFQAKGRVRKTIGNPFCAVIDKMAKGAVRAPAMHDLQLLKETV